MIEMFFRGGVIFMGALTVLLLLVIILTIINAIAVYSNKLTDFNEATKKIKRIRSVGLLALVIGVLGQLIGLFSAFKAVKIGEVEASPSIMQEGFKISAITTVYGSLIFLLSLFFWFVLKQKVRSNTVLSTDKT